METGNSYFQSLYSVDFGEINGVKKPKDQLIELTIKQIVLDFLNSEPKALLHYVCDSYDGRNHSRSRLFSNWFESYKGKEYSKFVVNYKNDEVDYGLEFIFCNGYYIIEELEMQVINQMDEFSKSK